MFKFMKTRVKKNYEDNIPESNEEIIRKYLQDEIIYETDMNCIFNKNINYKPGLLKQFFEFCHQMRLSNINYCCFIRVPATKETTTYVALDASDIDKVKILASSADIKFKKTTYEINAELINPDTDIVEPIEQRIFTKLKKSIEGEKLAYFINLYHNNKTIKSIK